tara:strand:+ start:8619 stop:10082 length:1464 start_codon:yes stop_codon:yes gene_type:complete
MAPALPSSPAPSRFEYVEGWGMSVGSHSRVLRPTCVEEIQACFASASESGSPLTLRGTGCSYGDASTNSQGHVLDLTGMNRILGFDADTGVADLEGGVTIRGLWQHSLPRGYWPKVVSGTMHPTVAGAAAMNIHGKNNFKVGTFGDHTLEVDLVLPSGELVTASREQNADLFHAAIGGLGLLGCIVRVKTRTHRVHSGDVEVKGISCHDLEEMMAYVDEHKASADYLVGWIDCFQSGDGAGRGLLHHARYLEEGVDDDAARTLELAYQELPPSILGFPKAEVWRVLRLLNHDLGMRFLNAVKHQMGRMESHKGWSRQSHAEFNFLLDFVPNWKFAYGRKRRTGLIQYQAFLPKETAHDGFLGILERSRNAGHVPYLGVLKRHKPDPFWLTHAVDGWSLALDYKVTPSTREDLWRTCEDLTRVVIDAGGRFYFAKDTLIGPGALRATLPQDRLEAFGALKRELDPGGLLESDLWRRINAEGSALSAPA